MRRSWWLALALVGVALLAGAAVGGGAAQQADTVYVGDDSNNIYALDSSTGNQDWSSSISDNADSWSKKINGTIYAGTSGTLYAFDASTGNQDWTFTNPSESIVAIAVANGTVYIGEGGGGVWAVDASTGTKEWQNSNPTYVSPPIEVVNATVYVGSSGANEVYALDASTGNKDWSKSLSGANPRSGFAVQNGSAYFGDSSNTLYRVDASTGNTDWTKNVGANPTSTLSVVNGTVYSAENKGGTDVLAIDAATGNTDWTFSGSSSRFDTGTTVDNGSVYAVNNGGVVYSLDASTGTKNWQTQPQATATSNEPAVANGTVYVTHFKTVYALDASTGNQDWSTTLSDRIDAPVAVGDAWSLPTRNGGGMSPASSSGSSGPSNITISGYVNDTTGAGIAGATIQLQDVATGGPLSVVASNVTAADGYYSVDAPPDLYGLSATGRHGVVTDGVTIAAQNDVTQNFSLNRATKISGQVTNASTGSGIAGVNVDISTAAGVTVANRTTNVTGYYSEISTQDADHIIDAYQAASPTFFNSTDVTVTSSTNNVTADFAVGSVQAAGDIPLTGSVVSANGQGLGAANITIAETGTVINNVSATGTWVGSVPFNGTYTLTASAPNHLPQTKVVNVTRPNETGIDFVLSPTGAGSTTISGTVLDPNGQVITDATVSADGNQVTTGPTGGYTVPVSGAGSYNVTAYTNVDSAKQNVSVPAAGAVAVDFVLQTASGGQDPIAGGPVQGNLEIRDETTGGLVNDRNVSLEFITDDRKTFSFRRTGTGIIQLSQVPQPEPLVAVASADGYRSRRIIIDDKSNDQDIFLLPNSSQLDIVINEFDVTDFTGNFGGDDVRFSISKAVALPGEEDNIPFRVLSQDKLGPDRTFSTSLEADQRYRIQVRNGDGDIRDIGPYFVSSGGVIEINIGNVQFERSNGSTVRVSTSATDLGNDDLVRFSLRDPVNRTSYAQVKIYNVSNRSHVIHNKAHTAAVGNLSNLTVTKTITAAADQGTRWAIEYSYIRNGETQTGFATVSTESGNLPVPLDPGLQQMVSMGLLFVVGGLFSARNAAVGAIIVPAVGGLLYMMGIMSGAATGLGIALALTVGVLYNLSTRGV